MSTNGAVSEPVNRVEPFTLPGAGPADSSTNEASTQRPVPTRADRDKEAFLARMQSLADGLPSPDPRRREAPDSVQPWSAFRTGVEEEVAMLVDELIPVGGLCFMGSPAKSGKTWLALAFAISVASAMPAFERFRIPAAHPVLYLALEGRRSALRTRVGCLARGLGIDPEGDSLENLHFAYRPRSIDLMDAEWANELAEQAKTIDARAIFVDVLRAAAPKLRETGEGSVDFAQLRENLAALVDDGGPCFCSTTSPSGTQTQSSGRAERMTGWEHCAAR